MRYRNWFQRPMLAGLALVLMATAWACDTAGTPTSPQLEPAAAAHSTSAGYTLVKESSLKTGSVSKVIGSDGGELAIGEHVLKVPAGAVSVPTTFVMTRASDALKFDLTATYINTNDVGSQGFAKPVTLKVNFGGGVNLPRDLNSLVGLWLKYDGTQEAQPSTVDVHGKNVFVTLKHFSDYGLAYP